MFNKDGKFGFTFWVLLLNNNYIRDEETGLVLVYREKETAIWEAKYYKECRQIDVEVVEFTDFSINYLICDF
jgi:ABC-type metal ion transport system substrate-binding protein